MSGCPWKVHWGVSQEATSQCRKDAHLPADQQHEGPGLAEYPGQTIVWLAGDRREYTGPWPGPCAGRVKGCVLHAGHHGRCAP